MMTPAGNMGIGTTSPARQLHISGNNATVRIDRNVDSSQFLLVRTSGDFTTVWKTFVFGVKATGVDAGKFFIGDMHTNVGGTSDNRLLIDTSGNVGIGTTTPSSKLHVTSDSSTSGDTGVTVEIPGIGTRRIIVGDTDSAGAGFRTLRVAN